MKAAKPRSLRFKKPMLAKEFENHEKKVTYPCYVQPKVDGIRCITDGQRFWSRNGKLFPQQNLKHLQLPRFPYLVDGELSLTGFMDFEEIVSVVKRGGHVDRRRICFNAFDIMTKDPYVLRKMALKYLFHSFQAKILANQWNRLTTKKVASIQDLRKCHRLFLDQGYEGTMVRSALGLYVPKRTPDLLKWKPLKEGEFTIVGVKEAKGKDRGTPIYVCATEPIVIDLDDDDVQEDWTEFRVRPMGTMKQRRRMWRERRRAIGKPLTVEYQNLTRYGVPRFPRAKVLRDYE